MMIFFSESEGRTNVPADSPVNETTEGAVSIFRKLDLRRGFMGIVLSKSLVFQLLPKREAVRIEILDTSGPFIDACETNNSFAEVLIETAGHGKDVARLAKEKLVGWEHLKLG